MLHGHVLDLLPALNMSDSGRLAGRGIAGMLGAWGSWREPLQMTAVLEGNRSIGRCPFMREAARETLQTSD